MKTQIPVQPLFTRTVFILKITTIQTPCSTGLIIEEPKLSVKTVNTDSGVLLHSYFACRFLHSVKKD